MYFFEHADFRLQVKRQNNRNGAINENKND